MPPAYPRVRLNFENSLRVKRVLQSAYQKFAGAGLKFCAKFSTILGRVGRGDCDHM